MTNKVWFIDDGYSTVGTLKAIEEQLKDEITEYLYNREDILGCDAQADWEALCRIQRGLSFAPNEQQSQIYKLSFEPNYFDFTIEPFDNFIDDDEKMADFRMLSKDEFLKSYSYLSEEEYDNTAELEKWA